MSWHPPLGRGGSLNAVIVSRSLDNARLRLAKVPSLVWLLVTSGALWIAYWPAIAGYDAMYALVWGRDMIHGRLPEFEVPVAPTPHPLANGVGGLLSLLGDNAPTALGLLVGLSFGLLVWSAFQLGKELFSVPVGLMFALILATRDILVAETLHAIIDIPFLALVLWAATIEVRKPRRGTAVLVVLSVAGLLRPEAWLLAGAYLFYVFPTIATRERWRLAAIACSAPLIWAVSDFIVTGDPLFSLHGTRELAAELERPRDAESALKATPELLEVILNTPVVLGGIAGCLAGLYVLYERSLLPAALVGLGLLSFIALGLAGLPGLIRYLLLPASMLALFCGVAAFGWLNLPGGDRRRLVWIPASVLLIAWLIGSIEADRSRINEVREWTEVRQTAEGDLRDLTDSQTARAWYGRCGNRMYVPNHRVAPLLAYWLDRSPDSFVASGREPSRGLLLSPATSKVAVNFILDPAEPKLDLVPPAGFTRVAVNPSWTLYARC